VWVRECVHTCVHVYMLFVYAFVVRECGHCKTTRKGEDKPAHAEEHVYVLICVCARKCAFKGMYVCGCEEGGTGTRASVCVNMCACVCVCVRVSACMCVCVSVRRVCRCTWTIWPLFRPSFAAARSRFTGEPDMRSPRFVSLRVSGATCTMG